MSNTQFIHSLGRIESILCFGGDIDRAQCLGLLDRVVKLCGCFRGRKSFPCLQDQSVIIALLNIAQSRNDAQVYLYPHLEIALDIISEFMNNSLVSDREFIFQFYTKMVRAECCVKEIMEILSAFYFENGDVFSAELYWSVLSLVVALKDATSLLPVQHICDITSAMSNIVGVSTKGFAGGAMSASLSLTASLILNESIWRVGSVDTDKSSNLSKRTEITNLMLNWCKELLHGDICGVSNRLDLSTHSVESSWRRSSLDLAAQNAERSGSLCGDSPSSYPKASTFDRKQSVQSESSLSKHSSRDERDIDPEGITHVPYRNVDVIEPSILVSIVVAIIACGRIDPSHWNASLETGFSILQFLLTRGDVKDTHYVISTDNVMSPLLAGVLISKTLMHSLSTHALTKRVLSAPSVVDAKSSVSSSELMSRLCQMLSVHVKWRSLRGTTGLDPACVNTSSDCVKLLRVLFSSESVSGQALGSSNGGEDIASVIHARVANEGMSKQHIELTLLLVHCFLKDCQLVGWTKSSLRSFVEDCLQTICNDIMPQSFDGTDDSFLLIGGPRHHSYTAARVARIVSVLSLLGVVFDYLCVLPVDATMVDGREVETDLSLRVAEHIYPSLFDAISFAVLSSPPRVVGSACFLLAKLCVAFPDSFLLSTVDWLCCTFSRTLEVAVVSDKHSDNGGSVSKRMSVLSGLGKAMECIVKSQVISVNSTPVVSGGAVGNIETRSLNHLLMRATLNRLLELFANLANTCLTFALTRAIELNISIAACLVDPSCLSMGLIYILHPIADAMEELSTVHVRDIDEDMVYFDIPLLRTMWIHLSLLQINNRNQWYGMYDKAYAGMSFQRTCQSADKLARYTPPLVAFGGGQFVGSLEKELMYCPVAKAVSKCMQGYKLTDSAAWIDICTGHDMLMELLSRSAVRSLSSGNIGALLYFSAVRCLEGIRISSHHEGRVMFYYLCSAEITSSPALKDAFVHMASKHLFPIWESAIMGKQSGLESRQRVLKLYQFVVTRTVHASQVVRTLALEFVDRIFKCSPWVYWNADAVFTLFECLEVLSCLKKSETVVLPRPKCIDHRPWRVDLYLDRMPAMEFPSSNEAISAVATSTLTMCYVWFAVASQRATFVIHEILHEYVLMCGNDGSVNSYSDVGVSVASEICSSHQPGYHFTSHDESEIFHFERCVASRSMSERYKTSGGSSGSETAAYSRPSSLMYKARYVGEANGIIRHTVLSMYTQGIGTDQSKFFSTFLNPFYDYFNDAMSSASFTDMLITDLKVMIVKSAAYIRELTIIATLGARNTTAPGCILDKRLVREHALVCLRHYSKLLTRFFSSSMVTTIVFVWRWLAASSSALSSLVIESTLSCFDKSTKLNLGLFHKHSHSCREGGAPRDADNCRKTQEEFIHRDARAQNVTLLNCCDKLSNVDDTPFVHSRMKPEVTQLCCTISEYNAHEEWIDFIGECLSTYSDHSEAMFDTIASTLKYHQTFSTDSSSLVARFKLLCLAFRLLKSSLISTSTAAKKNKRHIMRERIIYLSLMWFVEPVSFPSINPQHNDEEFFVLKKFSQLFVDDSALWVIDYANDVSLNINESGEIEAKAVQTRGPGAFLAINHLRTLMQSSHVGSNGSSMHRQHSHEDITSRHRGIDIPVDEAERAQYDLHKSGLVWLVRALTYNYMDLLVACRASHNSSDVTGRRTGKAVRSLSSYEKQKFAELYSSFLNAPEHTYAIAVEVAWVIHPPLALSFVERFKCRLYSRGKGVHGHMHKAISTLLDYIACNPSAVRKDYRTITYIPLLDLSLHSCPRPQIYKDLIHWAVSPAHVVFNLISRRSLHPFGSGHVTSSLHSVPLIVQYAVRSLRSLKADRTTTLQFFLAQMVQLLRRDTYGKMGNFLSELATSSTLLCHQLIWLLQLESVDENDPNRLEDGAKRSDQTLAAMRHGHCHALRGPDPLPILARDLLKSTRNVLSPAARAYLDVECEFFNNVTNISAKLKQVRNKELHNGIIKESLIQLGKPDNLYLPTDPMKAVLDIVLDSGAPMQSAAKCPFLLVFHTSSWGGPDSMHPQNDDLDILSISTTTDHSRVAISNEATSEAVQVAMTSPKRRGIGRMDSANFKSPKLYSGSKNLEMDNSDRLASQQESKDDELDTEMSRSLYDAVKSDTVEQSGRSVASNTSGVSSSTLLEGLNIEDIDIRGSESSTSSDEGEVIRADRAVSLKKIKQGMARMWTKWADSKGGIHRIHRGFAPFRPSIMARNHLSPYPVHVSDRAEGIDACIFKVYDDCRQDALTVQIIRILRDAFDAVNLPLYLVPYRVVPNRTGKDMAQGGILEVVANVKSRDQLGKEGAKTLKQHFVNRFGDEESPSYKQAQLEFVRSMAGYAIVCYLLSIKDRHSGNILIDSEGHLIHIDFGFLLGISPGGNLGFENAAFKFSKEMVELMGGSPTCDVFKSFEDLTVKGFMVARSVMSAVLAVTTVMVDSGLPCFLHKEDNVIQMQDRFFPHCTDTEAAKRMRKLVIDAANKWTTVAYDGIQKIQNNIYSDSWK